MKITGGTTERSIYGGYAEAGNAIRNHFTMEDGVVGTEDAGNLSDVNEDFYGGYSQYGSANENTVTISGGTIYGEVHGGRAEGAWIGDNEYATGDAIGNSVTISGGTIHDFVYGGFAGNGRVEGNTVDISNGTVAVSMAVGHVKALLQSQTIRYASAAAPSEQLTVMVSVAASPFLAAPIKIPSPSATARLSAMLQAATLKKLMLQAIRLS